MAASALPPRHVQLAGPDDVDGALAALAELLTDGVAPEAVRWHDGLATQSSLFDTDQPDGPGGDPAAAGPPPRLQAEALALLRHVLLHEDPERFPCVHQLAQRLHADARHWLDRLHPLRLRLERMAREVRREIHKMHAFVRFRPVQVPGADAPQMQIGEAPRRL